MTEDALRERIVAVARSLFERGLTHGSTGNISARLADGRWLVTPTGSSFGTLDADTLEIALTALDRLNDSGKMIGIISHVEALKERIAVQVRVEKGGGVGHSRLVVSS
jgi:ribulose-5-phosphate 4-epimerase/fuculose-1-phosphate aldolase